MTTRYRAPVAVRHFIKEWLLEFDLSQQELADLMETDKANVTRWIGEPRRVNLDVLTGISEALKGRFPEMAEPGNLLKSPDQVRALDRMRHAAEIITAPTKQPRSRK
jgi:transcriptional regulator with XRE-family HTH domain